MADLNAESVSKQRIGWVDAAKGLTIMLVVMEHTTFGVANAVGYLPPIFGALAEFTKPFRMPLFFLVAGLFAYKALYGEWRKFVDGKIVHFAYFYLLWSIIQIGIKLLPHEGAWEVTYHDLLMIPIQPFAMLWFIYALAIFFFVMRCLRNVRPAFVIFFALALYFTRLHTGWMLIDEFTWRFIWFALGVYGARHIFELTDWAQAKPLQALGLAGALLLSLGTVVFSRLIEIRGFELLMGFAGAGSSIILVSLLASQNMAKTLTYIGKHSLFIFVSFFLPMAITRIGMTWFGYNDGDVITLIATTLAVVTPIIAYHVVKDTPLRFLYIRPDMFRLKDGQASNHPTHAIMTTGSD